MRTLHHTLAHSAGYAAAANTVSFGHASMTARSDEKVELERAWLTAAVALVDCLRYTGTANLRGRNPAEQHGNR